MDALQKGEFAHCENCEVSAANVEWDGVEVLGVSVELQDDHSDDVLLCSSEKLRCSEENLTLLPEENAQKFNNVKKIPPGDSSPSCSAAKPPTDHAINNFIIFSPFYSEKSSTIIDFSEDKKRDDDVAAEIPENRKILNVGEVRSTAEFTHTYNQNLFEMFKSLKKVYKGFRPIRGDGNCYYRAVLFSWIERCARHSPEKLLVFAERLFLNINMNHISADISRNLEEEQENNSTNGMSEKAVGLAVAQLVASEVTCRSQTSPDDPLDVDIDDLRQIFTEKTKNAINLVRDRLVLWAKIATLYGPEAALVLITKSFNNKGEDFCFILVLRILLIDFLLSNADFPVALGSVSDQLTWKKYAETLDVSLESYCQNSIALMGSDASDLVTVACPLVLGVRVRTVLCDRNSSSGACYLDYGVSTTPDSEFNNNNNNNDPKSNEFYSPEVVLLLKPGHYEILTAEGPVAPPLAEQDSVLRIFFDKFWLLEPILDFGVEVVLEIWALSRLLPHIRTNLAILAKSNFANLVLKSKI